MPMLAHEWDAHDYPRRSVYRIPVEIWTMIGGYDDSPKFRSGLARTCKLFWRLFTRPLYTSLTSMILVNFQRVSASQRERDAYRTFRPLVRTLATSPRVASLVQELRLTAFLIEPQPTGGMMCDRFITSAMKHDFETYRRDFLNVFSAWLPNLVKNLSAPDSAISKLMLVLAPGESSSSTFFDQCLECGPFSKLKSLRLECGTLSLESLVNTCKIIACPSLKHLFLTAEVDKVGDWTDAGRVQRCFALACSALSTLSETSPNMRIFDIHIRWDSWTAYPPGAAALVSAINSLRFPVIRQLHASFGYGAFYEQPAGGDFIALYRAHDKRPGKAVKCECFMEQGAYWDHVE